MKHKFLFLCTIILIWGCDSMQKRSEDNSVEYIRINPGHLETIKRSDLFTLHDILVIPGSEKIRFGEITHFLTQNDKMLVNAGQLNVFQKDGQLIQRIGSRGRGPGETISRAGLASNDSLITVLDRSLQKVVQYDYENNMITDKSINIFGQSLAFLNNNFWVYSGNEPNDFGKRLFLFDAQFNLLDQAYPLEKNSEHLNMFDKTNFFLFDNKLRFLNAFDNIIYDLQTAENRIIMQPRYQLDFGAHQIPESFKQQPFADIREYATAVTKAGYANRIMGYFENQHLVMFCFWFKDSILQAVYHKKNHNTIVTKSIIDDLLFIGLEYEPKEEWFNYFHSNGKLYYVMDKLIFKDRVSRLQAKLSPADWEHYKQSNPKIIECYLEDDNLPGIIIAIFS